MKMPSISFGAIGRLVRGRLQTLSKPSAAVATEEPPLRAELFSSDQMRQHGRNLAADHELHAGQLADRLLARLGRNCWTKSSTKIRGRRDKSTPLCQVNYRGSA